MADTPKEPDSQLVKLASAIGGASAGVFFIAAFFGHELWPAAVAVVALALMGLGFAHFITKPR